MKTPHTLIRRSGMVPLAVAGSALVLLAAALLAGCGTHAVTPPNSPAPSGNVPILLRVVSPKGAQPQGVGASGTWSAASASFNSNAIAAGRVIWFSGSIRTKGIVSEPVTLTMDTGTVTLVVNGVATMIPLPNAAVTYSATATSVTVSMDAQSNTWNVTAPLTASNSPIFLGGVKYVVPAGGLPAQVGPVTWQARFSSSVSGVTPRWSWSAAVYSQLSDYDKLGVKPCDSNSGSSYLNSDKAGSPENCKSSVVAGGTGSGGGDYAGSRCKEIDIVMSNTAYAGGPVTQTIPALTGGVIAAGSYTLVVPANALSKDTAITLTPDNTGLVQCNLEPSGLMFKAPYTLAFDYTNTTGDPSSQGYDPTGELACMWFDPSTSQWTQVRGQDNVGALSYTATSDHFSYYALSK